MHRDVKGLCSVQLDEQADREVDETVDGATLQDYLLLKGDWAKSCEDSSAQDGTGEDEQAPDEVRLSLCCCTGQEHYIQVAAAPNLCVFIRCTALWSLHVFCTCAPVYRAEILTVTSILQATCHAG